jgi:predicted nucleic acid-binding protein
MILADAGVWVAAGEPKDRFHRESSEILLDLDVPVAALDLTLYEIANALGAKGRQPRQAVYMLRFLERRCEENLVEADSDLMDTALEVASEHDLTAYDAAYVAAARRNGWTLVSTDVAGLVSRGLAMTPDAADYPLSG